MAPLPAEVALNDLLHALRNAAILLALTAIYAVIIYRAVRWVTRRARTRLAEKQTADQAAALHRTRQAQR